MPRRRGRETGIPAHAEINVVSLVDVAFTLLVIFIITAPILQGGVDVSLPQARSEPLDAPDGLVVTVDRGGGIYIGDTPATWEEFEAAFPDAVRASDASQVFLRADEEVPYGQVLRVLGAMRASDVANVGLVADPERNTTGF